MPSFQVVMKPGDRTVIAGGAGGGGTTHSVRGEFQKHTDRIVKVTVEAKHLAYEGGFVILYNESPYDPIFLTSRESLHAIYRLEDNA